MEIITCICKVWGWKCTGLSCVDGAALDCSVPVRTDVCCGLFLYQHTREPPGCCRFKALSCILGDLPWCLCLCMRYFYKVSFPGAFSMMCMRIPEPLRDCTGGETKSFCYFAALPEQLSGLPTWQTLKSRHKTNRKGWELGGGREMFLLKKEKFLTMLLLLAWRNPID